MEKMLKSLGIEFNNPGLYLVAFTHKSYLNENKVSCDHNERLEFLGDAVLELAVTDFLFNKFSNEDEGYMTSLRAALVRKDMLATVSKELGIGKHLRLSKGELMAGGDKNDYILANALEALIGAIYLDSGFEKACEFLSKNVFIHLPKVIKSGSYINAKSSLQAYTQSKFKLTPYYSILDEIGPDHDKVFTVGVFVESVCLGVGKGGSKQSAQEVAAEDALLKIKN